MPQVEEMELKVQEAKAVRVPGESIRKENHTGINGGQISTYVWGRYLRHGRETPKGLWVTALGPVLMFLCPQPLNTLWKSILGYMVFSLHLLFPESLPPLRRRYRLGNQAVYL